MLLSRPTNWNLKISSVFWKATSILHSK